MFPLLHCCRHCLLDSGRRRNSSSPLNLPSIHRGCTFPLPSNKHFPSVPRIGGNETQSRRRDRPISLRSSRVRWPRARSAPQPATGPPSPAASCGHGAPSHGVAWAAPSPLTSVWTLPLLLLATACRLICLCCFVFPVQAAAKRTTT